MNLKTKLAGSLMLFASASMAQATTYNVSAVFADGGMQGMTVFDGSFDWDGTSVSNFSGLLSESMWGWSPALNTFTDKKNGAGTVTKNPTYLEQVYQKPGGYAINEAPLLKLEYQLASTVKNGLVTASVFLLGDPEGLPDTNVFAGGGYDLTSGMGVWGTKYGYGDGNTKNKNAFFTLVFDAANPTNAAALANSIQYGDCTALGLMGGYWGGSTCMTGINQANPNYDPNDPNSMPTFIGTMGGEPYSLEISQVATVPVPAAAWLFGSALMTFLGTRRKPDRTMSVV